LFTGRSYSASRKVVWCPTTGLTAKRHPLLPVPCA
jgi:hypothetical protein